VKIPINRFVAFVKPWLNVIAGAIAAWLVAKLNLLGVPGLDEANTATWIAGALAWAITTGAAQLGDLKWLKGHHIEMVADAQVTAAALAPVPPEQAVGEAAAVVDPEVELADADVTDATELESPPPDGSNMPVQPPADSAPPVPPTA